MVIIGGGAAGLMAACRAGELSVPALLMERKHRVGSKLLMCGNGRCNLSSDISGSQMLADFGDELSPFLSPAITQFTPQMLRKWFEKCGLPLMRAREGLIFPRSERAPDVVRFFSDQLRRHSIPLCLNSAVSKLATTPAGLLVQTSSFQIVARRVLICTGGVSYPKTGSVGDGQKMAKNLGHRLRPYRPGLVGVVYNGPWWKANRGRSFTRAQITVSDGPKKIGQTEGGCECEKWGLSGRAISNATRLMSRADARRPVFELVPAPGAETILIDPVVTRPLKEAMVTVGGVDRRDIDPQTMQSRRTPGLFFAGEVLDVDGPSGGYNLTAAFATARIAVAAIAAELS